MNQSKPFTVTLKAVRERLPSGAHGDVHWVLNVRWAKKRTVTLCGLNTEDMRSVAGGGFPGVDDVECPDCSARLEI